MFTGLIEEIGIVESISCGSGGKVIEIKASFAPELKIGESVSINGACQSIISAGNNKFSVFCMPESLKKTNLDLLKSGGRVNLERAMFINSRLDGHIVQGHVDGCARLININSSGESKIFKFSYPTKYIIEKGSIAINGISLTVSGVLDNSFEVSVIPQTLKCTNLQYLKPDDTVNIEVDMFAKYVEKFLSAQHNKCRLSEEFLKENGF